MNAHTKNALRGPKAEEILEATAELEKVLASKITVTQGAYMIEKRWFDEYRDRISKE